VPEITADLDRRDITVQGVILAAPMPYEAGHELQENEASVLNQTWLENLRNNFASRVRDAYKEAGAWDDETDKPKRELLADEVRAIQHAFDEYVKGYEFGVRTGGRTPVDPIMAQALQLAEVQIKKAIKAKGMSLSEVGKEKIRDLCTEAVEKNPKFLEKARQIHAARQAAVDELEVSID